MPMNANWRYTCWNKILREQILLEEKKSIFGMTLSI